MNKETLNLTSEDQLDVVARALASGFEVGQLIIFEGPLGAGKTTMVRALCRALGVPQEIGIRSPTFTLINEVDGGRLPVVHADFYRILDDPSALDELGFPELCVDSVAFVEWGGSIPEIAKYASAVFTLRFVQGTEEARSLEIEYVSDLAGTWEPLLLTARDSLSRRGI